MTVYVINNIVISTSSLPATTIHHHLILQLPLYQEQQSHWRLIIIHTSCIK